MIVTASQKYIRVSSQKLKFVADSVKKMSLTDMKMNLSYMNNEAARKLLMTLDQAFANAQHNFSLAPEQLTLDSLIILRGPQYKRQRARSRGQGHAILKRTSHIVIKLRSVDQKTSGQGEQKIAEKSEENKIEVKPAVAKAKAGEESKAVKKTTAKKAKKEVKE